MKKNIVAMSAAVAVSLMSAHALADSCAYENEKVALDTRVLQTDLLLAALTCGKKDDYNAFMFKYRDELAANGKTLITYFDRMYGENAPFVLNTFITQVANDASRQTTTRHIDTFCSDAGKLFAEALAVDTKNFNRFASGERFAERHGVKACGKKQYAKK